MDVRHPVVWTEAEMAVLERCRLLCLEASGKTLARINEAQHSLVDRLSRTELGQGYVDMLSAHSSLLDAAVALQVLMESAGYAPGAVVVAGRP